MHAEVADGFAAHVHNAGERAGEAIPYSPSFPDGAGRGTRWISPDTSFPHQTFCQGVMCKDYVFVRISRCQVIPALEQILPCQQSKPDTPWKCLCSWWAHSHCIWCGWGSCACALLWIFTGTTNWMWPKPFGLTLHFQTICAAHVPLSWWCFEGWTEFFYHTAPGNAFQCKKSSEQDPSTIRNHAFYWEPLSRILL